MPQILLIDDDQTLLESLSMLLENAGYAVISANNGNEGYLVSKAEPKPDLIIMDIMMSHDMEGFELSRTLKEDPRTKSIPLIALSGVKKALNLHENLKSDPNWFPVDEFIEKPVKPETLLSAVSKWIKKS